MTLPVLLLLYLPKLRGSPMEMQTGTTQVPAAGPAPGIYTLPLGLASAMENGDPFATCFLAGTLHQLLVTIVVGLVGWAMGNGE